LKQQYINEKRKVKFQGELEDCRGEVWLFRSKVSGSKSRGFQRGFDVYSFQHQDILEHGATQLSL
jgi:hypothetical protein